MSEELLQTISILSRYFAQSQFVKGGGGNTSCKDGTHLWVKASGTSLAEIHPNNLVKMNRSKLCELYNTVTPADPAAREALVKKIMTGAVCTDGPGRASVEAPLHNCFSATYVVHTHPPLVNGLCCSKSGAEVVAKLFPDALWVEYIDPGYTLCMEVRQRIQKYIQSYGREPSVLFLQNHGIFVAGNSAAEISTLYEHVFSSLKHAYQDHHLHDVLPEAVADFACQEEHRTISAAFQAILGDIPFIKVCGFFPVPKAPLTPDHIVYMKSFAMLELPTASTLTAFKSTHGYLPKIIATVNGIYAVDANARRAELAMELCQDASLILQLAEAFGGVQYMNDQSRLFIENWEVEAYRQKLIA